MARDALSIAGATVVTAAAGSDALAALDGEPFDVAVLDIGLPGMDGYELLKRIRAASRRSAGGDIPAAALTAYARAADRTRSLRAGFQMHLSKPVQPTELAAAVLALIGPARIERPPDTTATLPGTRCGASALELQHERKSRPLTERAGHLELRPVKAQELASDREPQS